MPGGSSGTEGPTLEVIDVLHWGVTNGVEALALRTRDGSIACRLHHAREGSLGIVWVFGAGGGLGGPAGGLYERLATALAPEGVASLRLDYRHPGELLPCVLDTLAGVTYLGRMGRDKIILVGHSFGGAVVVNAGALDPQVVAVATLSTQTAGTGLVRQLSPRPLLLLHGEDDEVLPVTCSRDLYQRASQPKRLLTFPGCRHGLDDCREEIDRELLGWVREIARVAQTDAMRT